jgi:hypothetical protein
MGTGGTQYIRMGRFPASITNTGEAWIGRASDRNAGTMTVQLGGNSASNRQFEVVDYGWSVVLFSVNSNGNITASGTVSGSNLSGTNTGDQTNISGNAATATSATNSSQLNGLSKVQLWNNSGQGHTTYTSFGAIPNFGVWFMQGSAAGDSPQSGSQYYVQTQGLGNDYGYGTSPGNYGFMTAVARDHAVKYTYYRVLENGSWGGWTKAAAGYADTAGNITAYTINQSVGTGNAPSFAGASLTGSLYLNSNNDVTSLTGSLTLYSSGNATTSMMMFKNTTGLGYGNHGAITGTYNTYFVMDTTDRGWIFRNATTSANVASISNTGVIAATTFSGALSGNVTGNVFGARFVFDGYANWAGGAAGDSAIVNSNQAQYQALMIVGNNSAGGARVVKMWDNVQVQGPLSATADITAYYSDGRLKENLQPLKNAIFKITTLTGYTYNTNALGKKLLNNEDISVSKVGLIAQDLQKVLPEAVKLAPFDNDGKDNSKSGENYLTIQYEKIVPLLIEAIKEQQGQIEELKRQIEYLVENK